MIFRGFGEKKRFFFREFFFIKKKLSSWRGRHYPFNEYGERDLRFLVSPTSTASNEFGEQSQSVRNTYLSVKLLIFQWIYSNFLGGFDHEPPSQRVRRATSYREQTCFGVTQRVRRATTTASNHCTSVAWKVRKTLRMRQQTKHTGPGFARFSRSVSTVRGDRRTVVP